MVRCLLVCLTLVSLASAQTPPMHVTQPPTPVTQPPTGWGPLQAPLQGCALGTAIYRNGDNNTDSCLVMQCNNGDWEYTGETREHCGNCTVDGGYALLGGNKTTDFWTFDDTKFLDYGHKYEFEEVGNFVITQPGFDYSPSFGVNADLQTCFPQHAANLSCIQSITYFEPGIKVELVITLLYNITTPKGGITVIVNDRVQKSTIGVKSASAFFGTDGTVLVFNHNDIEEPANFFCISVVGSQGLSVSLCLHKMNPPSLYVFPMPILRNAPKSQLYGLCNTYTGTLQDHFIARKEPCGQPTTEKDIFENSWRVQK